jgi:predicted PurR-regulated permease PerM
MISKEKKKDLIKHKAEIEKEIRVLKFRKKIYNISIILYCAAALLIKFKEPTILFFIAAVMYFLLTILTDNLLKDFEYALNTIKKWEKED